MTRLEETFESLALEFTPKCFRQIGIMDIRILILLAINFIAFWYDDNKSIFIMTVSLSIYLLLIIVALSGFTEWIFRLIEDVRRVATETEKERLIPLFNEVYSEVKKLSKNISDKVQLYIIDTMIVNAFAIGKNTITITRGMMSTMNDEEIKGVIAHEFAHIANKDTQIAILISVATNFFLWGALLISKLFSYVEKMTGSNSFIGNIFVFIRTFIEFMVKYTMAILTILVSSGSRKREYRADRYAMDLGYGEPLISALYKLYDMQVSDKMNLIDRIRAGHPRIAYRIEELEELINNSDI